MNLTEQSVIRLSKEKDTLLNELENVQGELKAAINTILQMEYDYEALLVYAEICNVDVDDFRQALAES